MRLYKGETAVEPRTVLRLGNSHYISLPPEFVRLYSIKRGDRLPMITTQESVKIIPLSEKHLPEPPEPTEPGQKIRCPLCHCKILLSSYASHIANYCPQTISLKG